MRIKAFRELTQADERTLAFGGMGLRLGGQLRSDDAAHLQQRAIESAELGSV